MIRMPGRPDPPVPRLIAWLASRPESAGAALETLVLSSGSMSPSELAGVLAEGRKRANVRVLVIGPLGVHPDASATRLRSLWEIEETCRASGLPVMALRLGPLVGPDSPLWLRLRSRPALGARGQLLLCPVAESDAQATLERAFVTDWTGCEWYEVAGSDPITLEELGELASRAGRPTPPGSGAWEPSLDEMAEARVADPWPWRRRFAVVPAEIGRMAVEWS